MAGEKIFIDTNILVYANNTLSSLCIPARAQWQSVYTPIPTPPVSPWSKETVV
ncbi:MAG: hypothetical protein IPN74_01815 [Haliscomenobacter sp.]|nr:hypothetical protein [Haliscomenobacter sp.]MBK8877315.1 hypothetical protein [Haliscomenobacter sp.]